MLSRQRGVMTAASMPGPAMDTPPIIRCTARHLPAIRAIFNDAILRSTAIYEYRERSESDVRRWLAAKRRAGIPVLGIEAERGMLAGFATWTAFRARPASKYSAEHSVYVAEAHRGRGIGRRLLDAVVAEVACHDVHVLVAGIDSTNAASIALHRSAGFAHCGTVREAGFKFGRWLDLEFWQIVLTTPAQPADG
jgi:phosphinothricin acetyltransferase